MNKLEAIKLVKQAICVCDLGDLPQTKERMCEILETLRSQTCEEVSQNFAPNVLH